MKPNSKLILVAGVTVGAALLLIFYFKDRKPSINPAIQPITSATTTAAPQQPVSSSTNPAAALEPEVNWDWTNQVPLEKRAWMIDRAKKMIAMVEVINVPIMFYGKIIDQFDQPVEGVRVAAFYNRWSVGGLIEQRPGRMTNYFVSDGNGQFEVKGIRGASMTIQLQKDGYELATHSELTFSFDPGAQPRYVPDPANPVVYRMWKRLGGVDLVRRNFQQKVRADGTPISLDLKNEEYVGYKGWKVVIGTTNFPGPTVHVWREPLVFDFQTALPNVWSYEFVWPGGKVQPTDDIFCYLAPEGGYVGKLERTIRKGDADYRYVDKRAFYFVNQRGQFGCGVLEILADRRDDTALVMLSVAWNPTGSRNLEPKPE